TRQPFPGSRVTGSKGAWSFRIAPPSSSNAARPRRVTDAPRTCQVPLPPDFHESQNAATRVRRPDRAGSESAACARRGFCARARRGEGGGLLQAWTFANPWAALNGWGIPNHNVDRPRRGSGTSSVGGNNAPLHTIDRNVAFPGASSNTSTTARSFATRDSSTL